MTDRAATTTTGSTFFRSRFILFPPGWFWVSGKIGKSLSTRNLSEEFNYFNKLSLTNLNVPNSITTLTDGLAGSRKKIHIDNTPLLNSNHRMQINWHDIDTVLLDMDGTLLDRHFDDHFLARTCAGQVGGHTTKPSWSLPVGICTPLFRSQENTLNWDRPGLLVGSPETRHPAAETGG